MFSVLCVCLLLFSSVNSKTFLLETNPGSAAKSRLHKTPRKIKPRILGGKDVNTMAEVPWQVGLTRPPFDGVYPGRCGGTIIDATHILSAAHCFYKRGRVTKAQDIKVYSGSPVRDWGQINKVATLLLHPDYNETSHANDLAVLVLAKPLALGRPDGLVQPACLSSQPTASMVGQMATASGWGSVVAGEGSVQQLQVINDLPILKNCINGNLQSRILPGMFCAGGEENKDVCHGDSGGPLVVKGLPKCSTATLVGIVSFGDWCGDVNQPSVYADVYYFLNHSDRWLCKALGQDPKVCPPGAQRVKLVKPQVK